MTRRPRFPAAAGFLALLTCAATSWADAPDVLEASRGVALHELLQQIRSLKTAPDRTVGEALDAALSAGADIAWSALVGGVEEERPARFYGTGECEVVLRIEAERLRSNLANVLKTHAKGAEIDVQALEVPGPHLAAHGRSSEPFSWRQREKLVYGPPARLEGWTRVDALDRAKAERAARDRALDALRKAVAAAFEGAPEAAEAAVAALDRILPFSKAYLEGGIIEVKYRLTGEELAALLRPAPSAPEGAATAAENKPALPEGVIEEAARRLAGRSFLAAAYADAKGVAVDGARIFRFQPVPPRLLPDVLPRPAPAAPAQGDAPAAPEPPIDAAPRGEP